MNTQTLSLAKLNSLSYEQAQAAFMQCCTASRWVEHMVQSRPFLSLRDCQHAAALHWTKMQEADLLEAFEGHPKIGDVNSLRAKYANTKQLASNEQAGVNEATEQTIADLAAGNQQYEAQNGFIFIVCASGKSAHEMLVMLTERLAHKREQELLIAAAEQAKITALRIDKLLHEQVEAL